MNANHEQTRESDDTLLRLVDFKWLMAGLGWWVSLTRLQCDSAYAREWVQRGLASGSQLVRQRSMDLLPASAGTSAQPC